jgi:ATP-dependent exoDNAse (exonuclease V) alpha subunit
MSREALYVAATRGRMENRLHVVTGANDAERLAEPERTGRLAHRQYDPPPALASSTLL